MTGLLKAHRVVLALALLTAFIAAAPQIYFRIDHRDDGVYQGIELLPDSPWSARAREVMDGHLNLGSIYYKEGKDDPYLFQPLGSIVVGGMGRLADLDINNTLLLFRLLFPAFTVLLIYAFVYVLSRDKLAALASAAVLILAESALSFHGSTTLLRGESPDSFLRIARPVNPAMIYILFFGFLLPFWQFIKTRDWCWGVLAAVILGLNFYNYFYSWTYLYAFGGVFGLTLLLQRSWREAVRVASVFVGALIIAIPYGVNLYRASTFPTYEEVAARFGVVASHAPEFVGWTVIAALIIFLIGFPLKDRTRYFFNLALLLTPFITMNQQIITGKVLQEAHYHWFFHKPVALIFVLIVLFYLIRRARFTALPLARLVALLLVLGSVVVGSTVQAASYLYDAADRDGGIIAVERQRYGPVMAWLNEYAEPEEVVLASDEVSHLTVIYTQLNVFYHHSTFTSLSATRERQIEVLFAMYRLQGVTADEMRETFYADRERISSYVYGEKYRQELGSYEAIPDKELDAFTSRYASTLSIPAEQWLKEIFTAYEVSCIVWDKVENPDWELDRYPFLTKAAEFGDLAVYRINW